MSARVAVCKRHGRGVCWGGGGADRRFQACGDVCGRRSSLSRTPAMPCPDPWACKCVGRRLGAVSEEPSELEGGGRGGVNEHEMCNGSKWACLRCHAVHVLCLCPNALPMIGDAMGGTSRSVSLEHSLLRNEDTANSWLPPASPGGYLELTRATHPFLFTRVEWECGRVWRQSQR